MLSLPKFGYTKPNFTGAAKELFFVLIFSFLPIILGILFTWLTPGGIVTQFLCEFLASGEPLLLSTALVGPLIYVLFQTYGELPRSSRFRVSIKFPHGLFFILVITLICLFAASVFGFNSSRSGSNQLLRENMQILSAIVVSLSIATFFAVSVVRNNLADGAARLMSNDTNQFLNDWDKT